MTIACALLAQLVGGLAYNRIILGLLTLEVLGGCGRLRLMSSLEKSRGLDLWIEWINPQLQARAWPVELAL
jgi:hypothetical protein